MSRFSRKARLEAIEKGRQIQLGRISSASEFRCKRLAMGCTLMSVGALAGISYTTIAQYERGKAVLKDAMVLRLCQVLVELESMPDRRKWGEQSVRAIPSKPYHLPGTVVMPNGQERCRFKTKCSRWNAAGLRRLPPSRFETAVNAILVEPRLYTTIHPGATFEDPADEGD